MLRAIYNALWWIVAPLAVLRLLIRSRKERGYREHIGERFGYTRGRLPEDDAPLIWVHAVSVGETRAAQPLIEALMKARPDARILLTHMTPSGRATGEQIFGDRVLRSYLPYDMPHAGATLSARMAAVARSRDGNRSVADADRRMPSCRRAAGADQCADVGALVQAGGEVRQGTREVFGGFARVLAQSPSDAERLTALGARNVAVLGNLKFDMSTPPELAARGHAWRAAIGDAAGVGGGEHARGRRGTGAAGVCGAGCRGRAADSGAASSAAV